MNIEALVDLERTLKDAMKVGEKAWGALAELTSPT